MTNLVPVRLLRPHLNVNSGEIAGFSEDEAVRLVQIGAAQFLDTEARPADADGSGGAPAGAPAPQLAPESEPEPAAEAVGSIEQPDGAPAPAKTSKRGR